MGQVEDRLRALCAEEGGAARVAGALVRQGRCAGAAGAVSLDELAAVPFDEEWRRALAALEEEAEPALEQVRLARLYELAGDAGKAAGCLARSLGAGAPSLALRVRLAEAAAPSCRPLALALLDALATALFRRDDRPEDRAALDPVQRDPAAMAALLEGAAAAAETARSPERAAVLWRTAGARHERRGARRAAFRCQRRAALALRAAGQQAAALDLALRLRGQAQAFRGLGAEAEALGLVAALLAEDRDPQALGRAIACEREAAKVLEGVDPGASLAHQAVAASLEARRDVRAALDALADAVALAEAHGLAGAAQDLHLLACALWSRRGLLGKALAHAERAAQGPTGPARVRAVAALARALARAGAAAKAERVLSGLALPFADTALAWSLAGESLLARAERAAAADRRAAARAFFLDAARAFRRAGEPARAARARLDRAALAAFWGEPAAGLADLDRAREGLAPEDERAADLLTAALAVDPDERELLLDDVGERVLTEGGVPERLLYSLALAELRAQTGDSEGAREALEEAVDDLVQVRSGLPVPLASGFRQSLWVRGLRRVAEANQMEEVLAPLEEEP
ncbi:MAG: hypothetical protein D6731_01325 [Planctomycetota bacterium]|nr:MAG: hypothetical protein D6731_01325 [Planctomycetota bacterium]